MSDHLLPFDLTMLNRDKTSSSFEALGADSYLRLFLRTQRKEAMV